MSFNGDRLRVLRRFHNLTQRELGELIGSPASTITAYEHGTREPKDVALDALCFALGVRPEFFSKLDRDDEFTNDQTNFRSLVSTPERLRRQVLAHGTLFGVLLDHLTRVIKLPDFKVPAIQARTRHDIERAAERCRAEWGVGIDTPIKDVIHMAEHAGVVVYVLDSSVSEKIDAFSRYGATNLIVLNPRKESATRTRFDCCHELGHGVLHQAHDPPTLKQREEEANSFASSLLLPQKGFGREFWGTGRARTWEHFFALKERWGGSLPALVRRAYELGLIDAADYRRRYKYMAKLGWLRGGEPGEPPMEKPRLFSLALERFQAESGKSLSDIASDLYWTPNLFQRVTLLDVVPSHDPKVQSLEAVRARRQAGNN